MKNAWNLLVCNSSDNLSPLPISRWTFLSIENLTGIVQNHIQTSHSIMAKYGIKPNSKGQTAIEYARLIEFQRRLQKCPLNARNVVVYPTQLPICFNDRLFRGEYYWNKCMKCGQLTQPKDAKFTSFSDDDGMQYYGTNRSCPCGETIAVRLEGHRRP